MAVERPGTHVTHCCIHHGCKYGHDECPVFSGELIQEFPCEECSWAKEQYEEAWATIAEGKQWWGD